MFKFRNLILAATAATIAIGGATAATIPSAEARGWKRDRDVYVDVDRRGAHVDVDRRRGVFGWLGWRDRDHDRGWFRGKHKQKKHWRKHRRHDRWAEPAPRYRPLK